MYRKLTCCLCLLMLLFGLSSCTGPEKKPKIGVSFGVGGAIRWVNEKAFMEERAKEVGADLEARLNLTDTPKTQLDDCRELIDSGIDVLILIPRDANKVQDILDYAKEKKVKVISYARVVLGQPVDLLVGYDSHRLGQFMGQFLSELVYQGDYIILRGDSGDNNALLVYDGMMRYIEPMKSSIRILLDEPVPGWSPDIAKEMVKEAIVKNNNQIDAILAPNDKLAGACAEALAELGITKPVAITGMDAEVDALKRIVAGTQSMTIYMNLRDLAYTAVDQACRIASGEKPEINSEFDNQSGSPIPANLITGQIITKQNLDSILIDGGFFTREEIYGAP